MELEPGMKADSIVVVSAQSERPFAAAIQLLSDNTLRIVSAHPMHVGAGWQNFINVGVDYTGGLQLGRMATIHADGRRFRTTAAGASAILWAARAHRTTDPRVQLNHHSTPQWFWWHDGANGWAITRTPTGHQIWWTDEGEWRPFSRLDFPWRPATPSSNSVAHGLAILRDYPTGRSLTWTFLPCKHADLIEPHLTTWLAGQFPTTPKEAPVPAKTLTIEITGDDLTNVELTIGDEHLARPINPTTVSWIQHTLDGRDLMISTLGKAEPDVHHIDTEDAAVLLHGIILGLAGGKATFSWLEAMMAELAHLGWDCASRRRERHLAGTAVLAPPPEPQPAPPSWPTWVPGNTVIGDHPHLISATHLRQLLDHVDATTEFVERLRRIS